MKPFAAERATWPAEDLSELVQPMELVPAKSTTTASPLWAIAMGVWGVFVLLLADRVGAWTGAW